MNIILGVIWIYHFIKFSGKKLVRISTEFPVVENTVNVTQEIVWMLIPFHYLPFWV